MKELSIDNFKEVVSVAFRGEQYLVQDNGAVCRLQRPNERKRPLDGVWTFGNQCKTSGYRRFCGFVVHKLVATAFHGEQPSKSHVVDHLDTNRRNNRIENLRWVTRLENLANNPITLRRIEQKWVSVEAMLEDPDRAEKADPINNRSWMPQRIVEVVNSASDIDSFTPLAIQRNWRTRSAFPHCPDKVSDQPLVDYLSQLQEGSVFSHNKLGEALVEIAALNEDGSSISVVTRIIDGVKNRELAKVTFENGKFVHIAHGTFFSRDGAEKRQWQLLGRPWTGENSIDDYC